jgi:hypothetical protein
MQFDTQSTEQALPQCACEYSVSISHNDSWKAMVFEYVINEGFSYCSDSDGMLQGNEVGIFCKSVNNHQYHVLVLR